MVIDPRTRERGCDRCASHIMVKIESKAGVVELCWSCALASMPGRDSTWLEARHAEFRDHLADRMKAAAEREKSSWGRRQAPMTQVIEKPADKIKCPRCGRQNFYHRQDTNTYRCQKCGHVWPAQAASANA